MVSIDGYNQSMTADPGQTSRPVYRQPFWCLPPALLGDPESAPIHDGNFMWAGVPVLKAGFSLARVRIQLWLPGQAEGH
jgi:hypothetical protein